MHRYYTVFTILKSTFYFGGLAVWFSWNIPASKRQHAILECWCISWIQSSFLPMNCGRQQITVEGPGPTPKWEVLDGILSSWLWPGPCRHRGSAPEAGVGRWNMSSVSASSSHNSALEAGENKHLEKERCHLSFWKTSYSFWKHFYIFFSGTVIWKWQHFVLCNLSVNH